MNQLTDNIFIKGQIILINKNIGWTSFDIVKKIKNLLTKKYLIKKLKVGHAGTLDPLATGLIIICTGSETKNISHFQALDKEYIATMKLGETTPSFDLETDVDNNYETDHITKELLIQKLNGFVGEVSQIPPAFSAKNLNGKRAYEFARKGLTVKLNPCNVIIKNIKLLNYNMPYIKIKIKCSKGTYIRALIRDIGISLNSGAHITELQRTKIGNYNLKNASTIEKFQEKLQHL